MNRTTRRLSLLALVGAIFYFGGCGPESLEDPAYLDQLGDNAQENDAAPANNEQGGGAMIDDQASEDSAADDKKDENDDAEKDTKKAQVMPGAMTTGAAIVATPVVKLPTIFQRGPTGVTAQAPVVTNTREDVMYEQDIIRKNDIINRQPNIQNHFIGKHTKTNIIEQTRIINQPSFAKVVRVLPPTHEVTRTVLPTEVVDTPVIAGPALVAPIAPYFGVRPGCAPGLSGGFYRYCGAYGRLGL